MQDVGDERTKQAAKVRKSEEDEVDGSASEGESDEDSEMDED